MNHRNHNHQQRYQHQKHRYNRQYYELTFGTLIHRQF